MQANESDLDNERFEKLAARLKELHVITFFETMTRHNKVIHIKTIKRYYTRCLKIILVIINISCSKRYTKQKSGYAMD